MNYFKALYELDELNTVHLSDKGSQQIEEFKEFVSPLIPDIRKGDAAKAMIAEYYLDRKEGYTEGAKKMLEPLVNSLGVSKGYLSQIRQARQFKESLSDKQLKTWVDEHPISIQYYMKNAEPDVLRNKMFTGEHYSRREAEKMFTQSKPQDDVVKSPASPPTVSRYDMKREKSEQLVDDPDKRWLTTMGSADCYQSSKSDLIRAAIQAVEDTTVCSEQMEQALLTLSKVCSSAVSRSRMKREEANKMTRLFNQ